MTTGMGYSTHTIEAYIISAQPCHISAHDDIELADPRRMAWAWGRGMRLRMPLRVSVRVANQERRIRGCNLPCT